MGHRVWKGDDCNIVTHLTSTLPPTGTLAADSTNLCPSVEKELKRKIYITVKATFNRKSET